jgi:hypothetical protein
MNYIVVILVYGLAAHVRTVKTKTTWLFVEPQADGDYGCLVAIGKIATHFWVHLVSNCRYVHFLWSGGQC